MAEQLEHWQAYIANPIYVDGKPRCLLEFASSDHSLAGEASAGNAETTLKLQILKLIAQWLGNEIEALQKQTVAEQRYAKIKQRFTDISPREKQVLALLVKGESSKSAAKILDISAKTVELHRANLLRKTGAKSSTELVRLAVLLEERHYT